MPYRTNSKAAGTIASKGIAIGCARVINSKTTSISQHSIDKAEIEKEVERFHYTRKISLQQLGELSFKALDILGEKEAGIFEGHILLLEDEELEQEIEHLITQKLRPADFAIHEVLSDNIDQMQSLQDPYLRARSEDMQDLLKRLLSNLNGSQPELETSRSELVSGEHGTDNSNTPYIIVADNLSPAETLLLDLEQVAGFITAEGGSLSHTVILAKSLAIPAIVNSDQASKISQGDRLILDAIENSIIINPENEEIEQYQLKLAEQKELNQLIEKQRHTPATTRDGHPISLYANIGSDTEVEKAMNQGAAGIGLFRSEFLFMHSEQAPSETSQFEAYRNAVEQAQGKSVILRTLDIGGDKQLPYMQLKPEMNPFLGNRGIRLYFDYPELFTTQIRAALRASAFGKLKLMFPMVNSVEEVLQVRSMVKAEMDELSKENISFDDQIQIGAMIETPASVLMADPLIAELDFFSIGSNDLTQYLLAVDRCNSEISHLYDALSPAVLRAMKLVVDAAHRAGKWVGVCGEMASCEKAALILTGLGVDELSMSAGSIGLIKHNLSKYSQRELAQLADDCVEADTRKQIDELIGNLIKH